MQNFFPITIPIILTALVGFFMFLWQRDHKRTSLASGLRSELGIINFNMETFFRVCEEEGCGLRVLKDYKKSGILRTASKIFNSNLDALNLFETDLVIEIVLFYTNVDLFENMPEDLLFNEGPDGFTYAESIFDGFSRHFPIIIPKLFWYTLPWWKRMWLTPEQAYKKVVHKGERIVYQSVEEVKKAQEKFKTQKAK